MPDSLPFAAPRSNAAADGPSLLQTLLQLSLAKHRIELALKGIELPSGLGSILNAHVELNLATRHLEAAALYVRQAEMNEAELKLFREKLRREPWSGPGL
jgi:hypothetical protein